MSRWYTIQLIRRDMIPNPTMADYSGDVSVQRIGDRSRNSSRHSSTTIHRVRRSLGHFLCPSQSPFQVICVKRGIPMIAPPTTALDGPLDDGIGAIVVVAAAPVLVGEERRMVVVYVVEAAVMVCVVKKGA